MSYSDNSSDDLTLPQAIARAQDLVQNDESAKNPPGTLADLLRIIQRKSTAIEFAERCKTIGLSPRMAYYLIKIQRRLRANDLELPDDVSWRKLVETLKILTWENAEEVFDYCRTHTREQVTEWAKRDASIRR